MVMRGILAWWRKWRNNPLVQAFALSVLFHIEVLCIVEIGVHEGWWQDSSVPSWMRVLPPKSALAKQLAKNEKNPLKLEQAKKEDAPLLYVEVDPALATAQAPPETPLYSARNSLAANPDPKKDTKTPKVDGKQTKIIKTVDTLKPNPKPLPELKPDPKPQPPPKPIEDPVVNPIPELKPEVKPETKPETKPQPKLEEVKPVEKVAAGNMSEAKPQPLSAEATPAREAVPETPAPAAKPRRRTLPAERRDMGLLAGNKMRQDGGVSRGGVVSSLDVKESPFGNYDEQVIIAIQQRWFQLLEQQDFTRGKTGKVVLEFRMMSDGRVTNMRVAENDAGDLLAIVCQKAVLDPVPYAPWPADMKRKIGVNFREVRFTFYYE
jgi:hypothetical protein